MAKRMTIMLICLAILFTALIGWRLFVNSKIKNIFSQPIPPVVTSTMQIQAQTWRPYLTTSAALVAQQNVNIIPQVTGIVSKIYFKSGTLNKARL
jgi:membrane fusion protein (multidrug efflux system)